MRATSGSMSFICSCMTALNISSFSLSQGIIGGSFSSGQSSGSSSIFLQLSRATDSNAPTSVPLGITRSTSSTLSMNTSKFGPCPDTMVSVPATGISQLPIVAITTSFSATLISPHLTPTALLDPAGILVSFRVLMVLAEAFAQTRLSSGS